MYKFSEETSLEVLEECYSLCESHFNEVGMEGSFNVDWDSLRGFLQAGVLCVSLARHEGSIVAYYMNIVTKDFMTSDTVAKELSIYVAPAHRGGRLFFKLDKFNTALLVEKGVSVQYMTFMYGHNDKLPLRLGYSPLEITYKKVIGEM